MATARTNDFTQFQNFSIISFIAILAGASTAIGKPSGEIRQYSTAGIAFKTPADWKEVPRNKQKTIAHWVSPDSTLDKPSMMIIVETGAPTKQSIEETAQGLANNFGGSVDDRPTTLGGSRALRIVAKNPGRSLRPVVGLVTIHEGRVYLVMGGSTLDRSVADEVEAIRASWKWIPIEPAHKHLKFSPEPVAVFGGTAYMSMPERMFGYPSEHPETILDLGLDNYQRNQPDFYAYVQLLLIPAGDSFDQFVTRLEKNLPSKLGLEKPLEFRSRTDDPRRVATPFLIAEVPIEVGKKSGKMPIRYAVVKLSNQQLILINFTISSKATLEERAAYESLTDQMIDSIKPGPNVK